MGLEDLPLLRYIKEHLLCGSRSDENTYRYRLCNQKGIHGNIRHSTRLLQLHRVCQVLDEPIALDAKSNWFAGFFDADGSIGIINGLFKSLINFWSLLR